MSYRRMCMLWAAKLCYEDGQSVARIAKSAKRTTGTVYRWLKQAGVRRYRHA